jgi:hypothetical protein
MAARPNLPLKPRPANLPSNRFQRTVRFDARLLDRCLGGIACQRSPLNIARSHRADFFLAATEISVKLRRR